MILAITSLLIVFSAASVTHDPVDFHQCSLVKFDLNDLDNALFMYKACSALGSNLTAAERHQYVNTLTNKMDVACLSLVLGSGVDIYAANRERRSVNSVKERKHKLYDIMNYLTDAQHGNASDINLNYTNNMDARMRFGIIRTIEDRIDKVHERLYQRCTNFKRSIENDTTSESQQYNMTDSCPTRKFFMADYLIGNAGTIAIALFAISAASCLFSLLICKICCVTDCSVATIHWCSKPETTCPRPKRKKKTKRACSEK